MNQSSLRSKRFSASSSRKLGREQKKKGMNFRAITRLETLSTQARIKVSIEYFCKWTFFLIIRRVNELEEEAKLVGNNLRSLEVGVQDVT